MNKKNKKPRKYKISYYKLFEIIEKHGETWTSFSLKIGISQGQLQRFFNGENMNVNTVLRVYEKIIKEYKEDIDFYDFFKLTRKQ